MSWSGAGSARRFIRAASSVPWHAGRTLPLSPGPQDGDLVPQPTRCRRSQRDRGRWTALGGQEGADHQGDQAKGLDELVIVVEDLGIGALAGQDRRSLSTGSRCRRFKSVYVAGRVCQFSTLRSEMRVMWSRLSVTSVASRAKAWAATATSKSSRRI